MTNINHPYKANEANVARSGATNLRVSWKNSVEISRYLKGLGLDSAITYLQDVVVMKKAIPFKRFNKDQAHRSGGMGPGRYPVNAAIEFLKLLKNLKNNAEVKGLDVNRLVVENAQANIGGSRFYRGARSFGRRHAKSTNISITVKEAKLKKTTIKTVPGKDIKKKDASKTVEAKTLKSDEVKEEIKK